MVRMKKKIYHIALKPFNNPIFYKNNIFNIDDGHNIFSGLKEKFAEKNVILNTIDIKKMPIYIFIVMCRIFGNYMSGWKY